VVACNPNEQDFIIMDTTRRKIIQSLAAAGVAAAVPGVANAVSSGTIIKSGVPQPERPGLGGTDPGPRNIAIDSQDPDLLAAPPTDAGDVPNLMWPFSLSHNRFTPGGWARQTTIREFPVLVEMAGLDMRLNPGAIRELHWHLEGESDLAHLA
jgi:oxalate decarboxylase